MKIGIIIGSVREGRMGESIARWFQEVVSSPGAAGAADGVDVEVIDLKSFDLPVLTSAVVPGAADRQYDDERVQRWSAAIDSCDGFVFVTPEYNHSIPGAFKNAFDSIGPEWGYKAVGFISYGADNGIRAVEHWRSIVSNFHMVDVRTQLSLSLFTDLDADGRPADDERRIERARSLADDLVAAVRRLAVSA